MEGPESASRAQLAASGPGCPGLALRALCRRMDRSGGRGAALWSPSPLLHRPGPSTGCQAKGGPPGSLGGGPGRAHLLGHSWAGARAEGRVDQGLAALLPQHCPVHADPAGVWTEERRWRWGRLSCPDPVELAAQGGALKAWAGARGWRLDGAGGQGPEGGLHLPSSSQAVSYTHLRAHET